MAGDFTEDSARLIVSELMRTLRAQIKTSDIDAPDSIKRITIPLDTAQREDDPKTIGFPFRSFYVEDATDTSTYVYLKPHNKDSGRDFYKLTKKDSVDMGSPAARGHLHWPAQAGKSITIVFFTDSSFKTGSQINQNSGGVAINEGSIATSDAKGSVGTSAAALVAANADRKVTTIQNQGSSSIWVGGAAVTLPAGANPGLEIPAGGSFYWRNTAALYAIASVANGSIALLTET